MPRKAGRRRKKRGGATFFLLLFMVLLVAGFLARRLMQPAAPRYVTPSRHRYPAARVVSGAVPGITQDSASPPAVASGNEANTQPNYNDGSGENLTPQDHRALDELIRHRSR